jgi:hypothetical protein
MTDTQRSSGLAARRPLICRRLRWKGQFVEMNHDPAMPSMDDGFVWCTHTHNCLGPDAVVADKETCQPGRLCFEGPFDRDRST